MKTKDKILKYLKEKKSASGRELSQSFGISRQATNKHLKELILNGNVVKEGTTKGVIYRSSLAGRKIQSVQRFRKICSLQGLEEDKIFKEVELLLNLRKNLKKNVFEIIHYTFTEILNNALEHSRSTKCYIETTLDQYKCNFRIRDYGIGIFYSIFTKFNLSDETSAIGELIKGKTTTMKEKHSGEGVFFTSKSGDAIAFRSHKINLIFDNLKRDVFVEERKLVKGTEVNFSMSRNSKRKLKAIFEQFAPREFGYRFEKTKAFVKLFQKECISRSEAKRLLLNLDKFKEIILDFKGVKSIGQGFADEIFRVFRKEYPDTIIGTENVNPTLKPIIKRAVDNNGDFPENFARSGIGTTVKDK